MKKFEITKEQILELANESSFTKATLNKMFPQAFESELEAGKWYKGVNGVLFYLEKISEDWLSGYGFTNSKEYYSDFREYKTTKCKPATDKEVETALIAEAKRRGFKEGVLVKSFIHNKTLKIKKLKESTKYISEYDKLHFGCDDVYCVVVYEKGKWAEICEEPIELTLDEIAEKFGVNVEQIKIKK